MANFDFTGVTEWSRIKGWFNLAKAIAVQQSVKQLSPGANVVELGSFHGRSSVAIAAVLPEDGILHCIDHFRGSTEHRNMKQELSNMRDQFQRNIEACGVADRIRTLAMETVDASGEFADESVDLILLDASHDFDSVTSDLDAWYPKLKPGGLLFCDDYDPHWPGVMQAVQTFGLPGKLAAEALWLHRKP